MISVALPMRFKSQRLLLRLVIAALLFSNIVEGGSCTGLALGVTGRRLPRHSMMYMSTQKGGFDCFAEQGKAIR